MVNTKRTVSLLLSALTILISVQIVSTVIAQGLPEGTLFYMFGESTCPYCQRQFSFFQETFPRNYYVCWIDKDSDGYNRLLSLVREELIGKANVSPSTIGVPLVLVVRRNETGKYLLAITIGSIVDRDFWVKLASREPSTQIPIYLGTDVIGNLSIDIAEQASFIERYVVVKEQSSTPAPTTVDPLLISVVAVMIVALGTAIYLALTGRKK